MFKYILYAITSLALLAGTTAQAQTQDKPILNASYDVAREVFAAINPKFQAQWKTQTGKELQIDQSFAGTSRQAQDIIQGKKVDTVTFNQVTDIDILAQRGLVRKDWRTAFPNNSSPYYSTIAFLVRKGNPKNIKGWDDLVRDDVKLVFPNPKTSGNARYTYLGAWLYANEKFAGDQSKVKQFVGKFLHNVVNFATGGRGATVAFAQNGQGDVLLTFESEVLNIAKSDEFKSGGYEVVVPPVSVLAEFPVAVVDKVVDAKGTRAVATAYLQYQYSREIQLLLTTFHYRVNHPDVAKVVADRYAKVRLIDPTKVLGSWEQIQQTHFSSGGVLDQLMAQR
ncbi:sulfate transport system substrate-binding protein [Herbaspirillum sp. Sphag1AN]|uniref:thiosulfate ABC transporter substrate-binding protein CysP n=1 Tax=unclassified Herbaspirillum TaxID=2624150 RepID=UPI00160DDCB4|nr:MULTISPECIES: thiosulfate ABC transporter substrate-binding protein CysP [unclassified Herbaspirillum]MBB3211167.1 sulfate transport system substrate-binding protein [Herbaspirillum sp. Sphag1AN]MBB3244796.1 sulfate transport system substrate-binding protein [Herbaspirillum sp. Sphag64]